MLHKMVLTKLLQVMINKELYDELVLEAMKSGLTISQVARLRLSNKKIIDKFEIEKANHPRFRPVGTPRSHYE